MSHSARLAPACPPQVEVHKDWVQQLRQRQGGCVVARRAAGLHRCRLVHGRELGDVKQGTGRMWQSAQQVRQLKCDALHTHRDDDLHSTVQRVALQHPVQVLLSLPAKGAQP